MSRFCFVNLARVFVAVVALCSPLSALAQPASTVPLTTLHVRVPPSQDVSPVLYAVRAATALVVQNSAR
jgi:hypothetical protein